MRILDDATSAALSRVTLLLKKTEASELRDSLDALLKSEAMAGHEHVPSQEFDKEITVSIYDEANISAYNDRVKKLIREDK
jgi:hypothetical protein